MTLPPHSGPWQPPPDSYEGQPTAPIFAASPSHCQQPPHWTPGPPKRINKTKRILLTIATLIAVAAVSATLTVTIVRHRTGSTLASAHDTAPVAIITEEPTCGSWGSVATPLRASGKTSGWHDRDRSIPASAWSPRQRAQYDTERTAIVKAASQTAALAKQTPHRVVRELYEQLIAYWRAYAERIPHYIERDDRLLRVTYAAENTIMSLCGAVSHGAAVMRQALADTPAPPTHPVLPAGDSAAPRRFLPDSNSTCEDFHAAFADFDKATTDWHNDTDEDTPASQWTPQQKALSGGAGRRLSTLDNQIDQLGRRSGNPVLEDFSVLAAVYGQAYARALPTYIPADHYLFDVTAAATSLVATGCKATGT